MHGSVWPLLISFQVSLRRALIALVVLSLLMRRMRRMTRSISLNFSSSLFFLLRLEGVSLFLSISLFWKGEEEGKTHSVSVLSVPKIPFSPNQKLLQKKEPPKTDSASSFISLKLFSFPLFPSAPSF
ncbi:hypothetical protein VNO77_34092 [Canavalia gladiata]|uniref:Transmembrane protein n=1 Tax=Canavalia gladiata TaxID=3824 RepID=A0AAN9KF10_CANGL